MVVLKVDEEDCAVDLFHRIGEQLVGQGSVEDVSGGLPAKALVEWLRENVGDSFAVEGDRDLTSLLDEVLLELSVVEQWVGGGAELLAGRGG